jgi:hypothetical protein
MTPDAPTMVLRLSVPASDEFRAIAAELSARIAEYAGTTAAEAKSTVQTIHALAKDVAGTDHDVDADITFEFHRVGGELRIDAHCGGRTSRARHPLPT